MHKIRIVKIIQQIIQDVGHYIVKFKRSDKEEWGIQKDSKIFPFVEQPGSIQNLIAAQNRFVNESNLDSSGLYYTQVELLAPVSSPLRVICQGLNYASHREESALSKSSKGNVIFSKDESAITGALSPIVRPKGCECLDYEAELGLVIKKDIVGSSSGALVVYNRVSTTCLFKPDMPIYSIRLTY